MTHYEVLALPKTLVKVDELMVLREVARAAHAEIVAPTRKKTRLRDALEKLNDVTRFDGSGR